MGFYKDTTMTLKKREIRIIGKCNNIEAASNHTFTRFKARQLALSIEDIS